ncbi:hypothetical protein LEP1GSC192_3873 [Leptospira sp. B5-022]|nr:hypothetical protein LEP1GSC192_3873 [Leptospira sp. B5-022]
MFRNKLLTNEIYCCFNVWKIYLSNTKDRHYNSKKFKKIPDNIVPENKDQLLLLITFYKIKKNLPNFVRVF